jgi:short-subunit dehydrogenase
LENIGKARRAAMKNILVLGANSTIAEHWLRLYLAKAPAQVTLMGRSHEKLTTMATDLAIRFPASVFTARAFDLNPQELVSQISHAARPDIAMIAVGELGDQLWLQANPTAISNHAYVNAAIPVIAAEALITKMDGAGTIAIFGSVAGDRGRAKNYIYGAGKAYIATAVAGMQQRLNGSQLKLVLIKPGPTATNMTRDLQAAGAKLADPAKVAAVIDRAIEKGVPVLYAPTPWRLIMLVIKHLPGKIFNRMSF